MSSEAWLAVLAVAGTLVGTLGGALIAAWNGRKQQTAAIEEAQRVRFDETLLDDGARALRFFKAHVRSLFEDGEELRAISKEEQDETLLAVARLRLLMGSEVGEAIDMVVVTKRVAGSNPAPEKRAAYRDAVFALETAMRSQLGMEAL